MHGVDRAGFSRERWLTARRAGIGGTDAAAIVGADPYRTAVDVWAEKIGRAASRPETPAMRLGTLLEPVVLRLASEALGAPVRRPPRPLLRDRRAPVLLASLDGLVRLDGTRAVVEAKTLTSARLDREADADGVLPAHRVQVLHYLGVTGCRLAIIAYLVLDDRELLLRRVERDEAAIERVRRECLRFWAEYVLPRTPPPATTPRETAALYPRATGGRVVVADDEVRAALAELRAVRAARAEMEARVDRLTARVQAAMGDAEELRDAGGAVLATWREARGAEVLDVQRLRRELPDVFARYVVRRPGARRFVLK